MSKNLIKPTVLVHGVSFRCLKIDYAVHITNVNKNNVASFSRFVRLCSSTMVANSSTHDFIENKRRLDFAVVRIGGNQSLDHRLSRFTTPLHITPDPTLYVHSVRYRRSLPLSNKSINSACVHGCWPLTWPDIVSVMVVQTSRLSVSYFGAFECICISCQVDNHK